MKPRATRGAALALSAPTAPTWSYTTKSARPAVIMPARHGLAVTPWFPGATPPARPGVYERRAMRLAPYSYWDGRAWGMSSQSVINAYLNRRQPSLVQAIDWRGLAEEPTL